MNPKYLEFRPALRLNDRELLDLVIRIEAYRIAIAKIPLPPSLQKKVNHLNILRAIRGTTGIEGNLLNETQIDAALNKKKARDVEEQEVRNASRVHDLIRETVASRNSLALTEHFIKQVHFTTTEKCDYRNTVPGQYRTTNVTAGEFRPPSFDKIPELMEKFIEFINSRELIEGYRPVLRAVLAHFYLVTIHPFADGNGRTSRAIEAFILYEGGYNIRGFYSLANFYYRHREQYIQMLQDARFKHQGDMNEFALFSLRGFLEELEIVEHDIHDFLRVVLFEDYIREITDSPSLAKSRSSRQRMQSLIAWLVSLRPDGAELDKLRSRQYDIVAQLYRDRSSMRTIDRDIKALVRKRLIVLRAGKLFPNFELMQQFES